MEEFTKTVTAYTSHTLEIIGALVVAWAVIMLAVHYFSPLQNSKKNMGPEQVRIKFGSAVAVALELLLGADVLATAVSPSWDDIGKLAAIVAIRTVLNYFLERELKQVHQVKGSGV